MCVCMRACVCVCVCVHACICVRVYGCTQIRYWRQHEREAAADRVRTAGLEMTARVAGLRPSTRYHVAVLAYNSAGTGPASPRATVTTKRPRMYPHTSLLPEYFFLTPLTAEYFILTPLSQYDPYWNGVVICLNDVSTAHAVSLFLRKTGRTLSAKGPRRVTPLLGAGEHIAVPLSVGL